MSTSWKKFAFSTTAFSLLAGNAFALTTYLVTSSGDTVFTGGAVGELRYFLNQILNNQAQGINDTYQINFMPPMVTLSDTLPMINLFTGNTITIGNIGTPTTIDGGSASRPLFIRQGNITLQNLVIQNGKAQGGNGGGHGGGGMGAGGALFIDNAAVILSNVNFSTNMASAGRGDSVGIGEGGGGGLGGDGGDNRGGGGGYTGNGGSAFGGGGGAGDGGIGDFSLSGAGGGGGSAIIGADGGTFNTNGGSVGVYVFGGGGGGSNTLAPAGNGGGASGGSGGGVDGGGGGGGFNGGNGTPAGNGGPGGKGGGGGGSGSDGSANGSAGNGGDGGGGGGIGTVSGGKGGYGGGGGFGGGDGGFGGGGGGGSSTDGNGGFGGGGGDVHGQGGFGGGGGGNGGTGDGMGGVGASNGNGLNGGGDGAGLGGAIFLNTGTLTIQGLSTTSSNTASSNGGTGAGVGGDIFLISGAPLIFDTTSTVNFAGSIADDSPLSLPGTPGPYTPGTGSGASLTMQGTGLLVLGGNNSYSGGTILTAGTLQVSADDNLGSSASTSTITFSNGAILEFTAGFTTSRGVTLNAGGGILQTDANVTMSGIIQGGSSLTKTGTAILTLSGPNTYSGGTFINAGTLKVSADNNLGSPAGALTFSNGSTLEFTAGFTTSRGVTLNATGGILQTDADVTMSGIIMGPSSLTKTGGSTLILLGTNTYGGGTTVSAGTLQGNTTSLQGDILNNSAVTFDQSGPGTYMGNMSGTGSLSKINGGTLILTGTNNYGGGTTVSGGTLQGNTTSLQGDILNNSAVTFDQSLMGTYMGNMSGTGSLSKINGGTLILTGTNTYGGGTTVSGGTLQGNTMSLQGGITNNSAVTFDQGFTGTYTGNMSGTGSLSKINGGTLILTGTNTYGGGTTVSAGTLQGNTMSLQGGITNDSAVTFDQGFTGTYTGNMSGSGSLSKINTGTLIFSGTDTYMGPTTVAAGRLSVNGSLTQSPVTVLSGATLGGIGTVSSSVMIQNGGFLTPGNSIGPLTIATLTLNSGSTTQIELDPTTSSEIFITNFAMVDGTLQVLTDPGTYSPGQIYNILSGPYSGTFSSLVAPQGFIYSTIYSPSLIQLLLQSVFVTPQINTLGLSGNNKKVANYLNKHAPNSAAFADLASLSGDTLKKALESVSPSRNALPIFAAQNLYFSLSEVVSSHLSQHRFLKELSEKNGTLAMQLFEEGQGDVVGYLADASEELSASGELSASETAGLFWPARKETACRNPCDFCPEKPYAFWVGAFAENLHQNSHQQTPGFNSLSEAVFAAFDYYAQRGVAGATTGYAHTQLWDQHHMGKANVNYYYSSVYGTAQHAPFYMDFAAWGGYLDIHSERNISFPGFHKTAKAHYHAWQFSPHLELGGDIDKSWGGFEPFVAFDYVNTWQVGFKEHGADSMNMKQKNHHSSMLRSSAGLRIYENWTWNSGTLLLKQQVAYVNRKIFRTGQVNAAIVGGTGSFFVEALMPTQNLGAAAFEALFAPCNSSCPQFSLGYFGEFGAGTQLNQIILKIIKEF